MSEWIVLLVVVLLLIVLPGILGAALERGYRFLSYGDAMFIV